MKKLILFIAICCLLNINYLKADSKFYRLSFTDDPATTINIGWVGTANKPLSNFTLYYGTEDFGNDYTKYSNSVNPYRSGVAASLNNFFVKLTNLQPKTLYYFVIRDSQDGHISERFSFMTLSDSPDDPISFISGGDTREAFAKLPFEPNGNCHATYGCRGVRQIGNRLVAKIRPDLIVFNGDYTFTKNGVTSEWVEWLQDWQLTKTPDGRMFPLVCSMGNHENNTIVKNFFDIDSNEDQMYYALNLHGNLIRLYTLNSSEDNLNVTQVPGQDNWFKEQLELYNQPGNMPYWNIVQYHVPMYPQGHYSKKSDLIRFFMPLFEQYKVRLVLESHTHIHKMTYPKKSSSNISDPTYHDGFARDDKEGMVFAGEGNWGAPMRKHYRKFEWTREVGAGGQKFGTWGSFFFVRTDKEKMQITTVVLDNENKVEANLDNKLGNCLPKGITYITDIENVDFTNPTFTICPWGTDICNKKSDCDPEIIVDMDTVTYCLSDLKLTGLIDTAYLIESPFVEISYSDSCVTLISDKDFIDIEGLLAIVYCDDDICDTVKISIKNGIILSIRDRIYSVKMNYANIFPNPATTNINVQMNEVLPENSRIEIYDAMGRFCMSEEILGRQNLTIDISSLCNGVNYLFIRTEEGVQSHKLIKH